MALFRADPESGLRKAQTALSAVEARIAELEQERITVLGESDAIEPVHAVDLKIAGQKAAAQTLADRIKILRQAVREQEQAALEKARTAAIAKIKERLIRQAELGHRVDAAVRELGEAWNSLCDERAGILEGWPSELPVPDVAWFRDLRELRENLAVMLHSAGRPSAFRGCSIPPPIPTPGVTGIVHRGVAAVVAASGGAFIARLQSQSIPEPAGEEAA